MNKFKINDYLTLKLEDGKINIYIKGKKFIQCKYLLLNKKITELEDLEIESVDEMIEYLNNF